MQSNIGETEGGLKGCDLSGLDCVLIEVTCIKWNLIGTDTGSLTDRHDADGLRGGGRGERGRQGEEERREIRRAEEGEQKRMKETFLSFPRPKRKEVYHSQHQQRAFE